MELILLDIDGTLVDSNDVHTRAWLHVLEEFGYRPGYEDVRKRIGMGGDKLLPDLLGLDAESRQAKEISARRGHVFLRQYLPQIKAFPRAAEFVARLRQDGYQLAVATSAKSDELVGLLHIAGVDGLFEVETTQDDARESKPEPDILEAALRKAGCRPEQALMIGDTPYDVAAARKAGIPVMAVRCGGYWKDKDFEGADWIFDSPETLYRDYANTPFASTALPRAGSNRAGSR